MRAVAEQLRSKWTDVDFRFELAAIAPWRAAAGGWAELATRARNAALGAIRRAGHPHCLVADGDEMWRPGVLVALADLVRARRPSAIESRWLPVVGLTGYPVGAATDQATMYVAAHASFVTARRECGARTRLPGRGIVYGTAPSAYDGGNRANATRAFAVRRSRLRPRRLDSERAAAGTFGVRRRAPVSVAANLAASAAVGTGGTGRDTREPAGFSRNRNRGVVATVAAAAVFPDPADGGLQERQLPSTVRAPAIEHMSPLLAANAAGPLQFWRRDGLPIGADRDRHAREFQPKTTR